MYLEQAVQWSGPISGKRVNCTYGDDGLVYEIKFGGYGGRPQTITKRKAIPWDSLPILKGLNKISTMLTEQIYNFCVAMCYPHGGIGINPHRDKEMKKGTTICGWSFLSKRVLRMDPPRYIKTSPIQISLHPGSMYEFVPPTNDHWSHCIEKDDREGKRISLTFRNY
ncbi:MAG: alpha-ketoglutarate-dependent dioxygenase AlkB [Candidatus Colwellbacteria bacterium]|nr:alpha-ketoglutarate-dependent dioxygenase AlkB [Candidatus Colwellbacteria bacterium]